MRPIDFELYDVLGRYLAEAGKEIRDERSASGKVLVDVEGDSEEIASVRRIYAMLDTKRDAVDSSWWTVAELTTAKQEVVRGWIQRIDPSRLLLLAREVYGKVWF